VLPGPAKPSRPALPKTTATWRTFTATKFFYTAVFTASFLAYLEGRKNCTSKVPLIT
jgi:hypothetical protein